MNVEKSKQTERGQALVIMVFGMIVLLIVAGVAIDGGTLFMERRHAQNAADATALAGTRSLAEAICAVSGVDDAAIYAQVLRLATSNEVNDPGNNVQADYVDWHQTVLGPVGGGSIPSGSTGVSTTVDIKRKTYFLSLAGIPESQASAHALAVTAPPLMAGGLRPFGVPLETVEDLEPGEVFSIIFKNDGGEVTWAGTNVAQHRGWMNMGYVWNSGENPIPFPRAIDESANAAVLKEWMENGWTGDIYIDSLWVDGARDGDFIHAKPGTNSSAVCAVPDEVDIFPIPVYDRIPECATQVPTAKPACPTQGSGYVYHIVGISYVRIVDCSQGGGQIDLELVRMITGKGMPDLSAGTGFGGAQACATHAQVVLLWK